MNAIRRVVCGDTMRDLFENNAPNRTGLESHQPAPKHVSHDSQDDREQTGSSLEPHDGMNDENNDMDEHDADQVHIPQLIVSNLEMITYEEGGNVGTAMTLSRDFVRVVNTVLRCENKIARYTKELKELEGQIGEMEEMLLEIRLEIDQLSPINEERSAKENLLESGTNILDGFNEQRDTLLHKLEKARKELENPQEGLYYEFKRTFKRYGLLEDISGASESGDAPPNQTSQQKPTTPETPQSPTEIEAQRAAEEEALHAAYDRKRELDGRVNALRERHDEWYLEYDDNLRDYRGALAREDTDITKTEFDYNMFCNHRDVIQDLILSEQELQEAIDDARALGIVDGSDQQESHFQDYADDGYRISQEKEWIDHLDHNKIDNWVNGLPDEEPPSPLEAPEGDADEWEVRDVDFGESISVIAEGKPRDRIDRWRSAALKHHHVARFDGDVDTEVEYQHNHQKRRCRRSNSF